jgi:hypothetical protein
MPRRKPVVLEPVAPPSGGVPPEIAVGAVVGVWGRDLLEARHRYGAGRRHWEAEEGHDRAASYRLCPARRPVKGEDAVARLHGLGLPVDLDVLRARAEERLSRKRHLPFRPGVGVTVCGLSATTAAISRR